MPEPSSANLRQEGGRTLVNRAGIAELAGLSASRVLALTGPTGRAVSGCPEPVEVTAAAGAGRPTPWWDLDAIRAWITDRDTRPPRPPAGRTGGDPDELIGITGLAEMIEVTTGTARVYVRMSRPAWDTGTDGYLPRPDHEQPARRGTSPRWRRSTIATWHAHRPGRGRGPGAGRPAAGTRTPQPPPAIADPDELIGETTFRRAIARPSISREAFRHLIAASRHDWDAGRDGALPRPAHTHHTGNTTTYRWRTGDAAAWQAARAERALRRRRNQARHN